MAKPTKKSTLQLNCPPPGILAKGIPPARQPVRHFAEGGSLGALALPELSQGETARQGIMADLNSLGKVATQPGQGAGASYNWGTKSAAEIAAASGVNPNAAYVPGSANDPRATVSFGAGRAGSVASAVSQGITERPGGIATEFKSPTLPAVTGQSRGLSVSNPFAAAPNESTFQQDTDARQSRITAYADRLKAMESNGRANSLMGSSSTITRGFARGGELGIVGAGAAMAAKGLTHDGGGIIRGPGTPTSDSLPAQVRETGEPIKVSTDDRIVSKAQNDLLDAVAKSAGYDSLDTLFEDFGLPVGPTIKGGKRHAATGMAPEDEQRTAGGLTRAAMASTVSQGIIGPRGGLATDADGSGIVGYHPGMNGITWRAKGFDPTQETMAQGTGAYSITSGSNAGKNVAIGPQNYTAADGSQTSDWSKTAQYRQGLDTARRDRESLATMQRDRLERDAFDPTITDPNVRANARAQITEQDTLAGKAGEAQGRLLENQIKRTKLASDSAMAGLQGQYLSEQDPARRNEIAARISALQGKGATAPSLQHVETENGVMAFDPRTGTMAPVAGPGGEPIKGSKPLTEFQGKSTSFGMRADAASRIIDTVGMGGEVQPSLAKRAADAVPLIGSGLGMVANQFQTPEQQQVEQGQRDFVNAVLRQESGAAISASEFDNAKKQYFPQPGDSAQVIAQKKANREMAINGFRISAGPGAKNIGGAPQQAQPAAGPQVGAVDGKHVFLGGNPADPASWAEVR
ncbi:MAG: hypothetical protein ABTQ26_11835 [Azonexus sp.]